MEDRKILGITIFVFLVIVMIAVAIASGEETNTGTGSKTSGNVINSYNTYNHYGYPAEIGFVSSGKYVSGNYYMPESRYLNFKTSSYQESHTGLFENPVKEYKVYVTNMEHKGGYFTVKYVLTDYYSNVKTETVTHYVKPRERKVFTYRNVLSDGKEYKHWRYEVLSRNKI